MYKGLVTLLLSVLSVQALIVRDYNYVVNEEFSTYADFKKAYIHHDSSRPGVDLVSNNIFLGVTNAECKHELDSAAFRGAQRHGGGNVLSVVILPLEEFPFELENCAQVLFFRINTPISDPVDVTANFEHGHLNRWMANLMRVKNVRFVNRFHFPIVTYWHEESADPIQQGEIAPGESTEITTFLGHVFSAHSLDPTQYSDSVAPLDVAKMPMRKGENGEPVPMAQEAFQNIVDFMVVNGAEYEFSPANRLESCEVKAGSKRNFSSNGDDDLNCDNMFLRMVEFTHNIWHDKRLGLNYVQPLIVRPVTESGFEHRRLPEATYKWLKDWYIAEKLKFEQDEGAIGPCMNQHVAPTAITHITPELKDKLSSDLQGVLEEWYGDKLTLTSIYGIRKYNNGSVLRMHVDTVNTHVVSAIINVDQEVEQDWPLLILDHQDNEHRVVMKAGDMVLYESAKLLHGRPDPFVGSHYDNIFIHYKPVEGWDYSW
eukprot:CAMPEP_0170085228 /NCGR_PEP_ID=MMETSP0019_2-20121128/20163_1 /TAXON_ID=98059 /ORGANISM="Dinobryon sp., Strain UTEXLB2267" /LENGTH=484 /DNA_ID=CAMNT_0010301583 /DNA_START=81 /DNA_END=1532 /DNA_ORIENTATION=-